MSVHNKRGSSDIFELTSTFCSPSHWKFQILSSAVRTARNQQLIYLKGPLIIWPTFSSFEVIFIRPFIISFSLRHISCRRVPPPQKCDLIFLCPSPCFVEKCAGMEIMLADGTSTGILCHKYVLFKLFVVCFLCLPSFLFFFAPFLPLMLFLFFCVFFCYSRPTHGDWQWL